MVVGVVVGMAVAVVVVVVVSLVVVADVVGRTGEGGTVLFLGAIDVVVDMVAGG